MVFERLHELKDLKDEFERKNLRERLAQIKIDQSVHTAHCVTRVCVSPRLKFNTYSKSVMRKNRTGSQTAIQTTGTQCRLTHLVRLGFDIILFHTCHLGEVK